MSTKVKGEAIKEGSIPLSALSNEVKDKIENAGGGADWNAKEGESGYIENKPFGVEFNSVNWFYDDNFIDWCLTPMISNKVKYEGVIYEIPDNADEFVSLGDGSIALGKYPYYDSNLMHVTCYGVQDTTDERLQNILFEVNTKLDEQYLPNTVLKTTPQTLSDVDKNQALTNIGIDPVVWRYICNPLRIQDESYILSELVKEGNFVVKAPNAYRFIDSSGHEYTPVEIGDTVMQVETSDGYVSLSLQYDDDREEYQIVKIL